MKCKYYSETSRHMDALLETCKEFYKLPGCGAGGPLHILLDDDNITDNDIKFCIRECLYNSEYSDEVRSAGLLICSMYIVMTEKQRKVFDWYWNGNNLECKHGACNEEQCFLLDDDPF